MLGQMLAAAVGAGEKPKPDPQAGRVSLVTFEKCDAGLLAKVSIRGDWKEIYIFAPVVHELVDKVAAMLNDRGIAT